MSASGVRGGATRPARERDAATSWIWSPTVRGTLCHQVIGVLAARGTWSHADIEETSRALMRDGLAPTHQASVLGFVVPAVASYHRHFDRPGWRFLGAEVIADGVAFDLVWQRGPWIEADEVKSGADTGPGWREAALLQAEAQLAAGRNHYGDAFRGVRVAPLIDPGSAFWVGT